MSFILDEKPKFSNAGGNSKLLLILLAFGLLLAGGVAFYLTAKNDVAIEAPLEQLTPANAPATSESSGDDIN